MNECGTIPKYGRGKIETIRDLLSQKFDKAENERLQKSVGFKQWLALEKKYKALEAKKDLITLEQSRIEKKFEFDTRSPYDHAKKQYGATVAISTKCNIPRNYAQALLQANKFLALGMRKDANAILDKIIAQEKLLSNSEATLDGDEE